MNFFEKIIYYISKLFNNINNIEKQINNNDPSLKNKVKPARYREFSLNTYF